MIRVLASHRLFFSIKDELAVRLEGSKACLQCSQHRYRHLGLVTFLKCICNNFASAGDAVLALGDEPLSLGQVLPLAHRPQSSSASRFTACASGFFILSQ